MRISPGVCIFVVTRPSERLGRCDWIVYIMWYEMTQYLPRWRKDFIKKILSEARKILHWRLGERPIHLVTVCHIGLLLVLSSCTGSQEPLQRTKQYAIANQWLLDKERTMVIPVWTGTPGQNPFVCNTLDRIFVGSPRHETAAFVNNRIGSRKETRHNNDIFFVIFYETLTGDFFSSFVLVFLFLWFFLHNKMKEVGSCSLWWKGE